MILYAFFNNLIELESKPFLFKPSRLSPDGLAVLPDTSMYGRTSLTITEEIAEKLLTTDQKPWITIPDAMKKIDDLRAEENTDKKFLNDYDLFIQDLESQHKKNL